MKGEIELYNISFLILKVELHFNYEFKKLVYNTILEKLFRLCLQCENQDREATR